MLDNYYFIDGSALMSQIRRIWAIKTVPPGSKLCPIRFIDYFHKNLGELHEGEYKRATFYFPSGDEETVERHFLLPNFRKSGEVRDLDIKYCGQKIKRSKEFDKFVEENVPQKWRDRFGRSEKGIDLEICCDALRLASHGKVERAFLLTNDDDFVPFCRTIKEYGANISIIHLTDRITQNVSLLESADSYDVIPLPLIPSVFEIAEQESQQEEAAAEIELLKPDVEPSDLGLVTAVDSDAVDSATGVDHNDSGDKPEG